MQEPGLFSILCELGMEKDKTYVADYARKMVAYLRRNQLLSPGWSNSKGGRMRIEQSLLAESWNSAYAALGFDADSADPPFLEPAVAELAKSDTQG